MLLAETRVRKEGAVSRNLVNFLFWFTHLFFINHLLLSLAHLLITIVSVRNYKLTSNVNEKIESIINPSFY